MSILTYALLILGAAAIWQLVRVVELSTKLKGADPNKVTERDNRLNGTLMLAFMILFFAFCIWQFFEYKDRLLPEAASEHGVKIDWLMNFNFLIIGIVFFITNGLLFYMAYKYYGRDGAKATYYPHNNKLEMLWTGVPAVVLFIIIFLGIRLWNNTMEPAPTTTRLVELYAQQFNWKARYAGKDNQLGKADYRLSGKYETGIDSSDVKGYDDIIVNDTLFLEVNQDVNFRFRSRDVIHSAFFPHFRAQMNCVPGMETWFHFKPTITTAEMRKKTGNDKFDYMLLCNKICGTSHWNMGLLIVVGTKKEYDDYMSRRKPYFDGRPLPTASAAN
jgi:cytochrome c oxidase subunit II